MFCIFARFYQNNYLKANNHLPLWDIPDGKKSLTCTRDLRFLKFNRLLFIGISGQVHRTHSFVSGRIVKENNCIFVSTAKLGPNQALFTGHLGFNLITNCNVIVHAKLDYFIHAKKIFHKSDMVQLFCNRM